MRESFHKVVWIDHQLAQVYDFTREKLSPSAVIHCPPANGHVHHKAGSVGSGHAAIDGGFLKAIADAIANAKAILIVGPGEAKTELSQFLKRHHPQTARRVLGQEPLGRVDEHEIHAFSRRFFARADHMARPEGRA